MIFFSLHSGGRDLRRFSHHVLCGVRLHRARSRAAPTPIPISRWARGWLLDHWLESAAGDDLGRCRCWQSTGVFICRPCSPRLGLDNRADRQIAGFWPELGPFFIVAVFTALLIAGTQVSAKVNNLFTVIKLVITTVFVIVVGFTYMNTDNFTPFVPQSQPPVVAHGVTGGDLWGQPMLAWLFSVPSPASMAGWGDLGASLVFFAFLGFDVVAPRPKKSKDPQRTLPRGAFSAGWCW